MKIISQLCDIKVFIIIRMMLSSLLSGSGSVNDLCEENFTIKGIWTETINRGTVLAVRQVSFLCHNFGLW